MIIKQVAFFSVSNRLDKEGIERLKTYAHAGHIIANHTHSHPDINKLSFQEYKDDFLMADSFLSTYKNYKKWFRFPYLREGDTLEKRDGMRALLMEMGYINAYITLNNSTAGFGKQNIRQPEKCNTPIFCKRHLEWTKIRRETIKNREQKKRKEAIKLI